MQVTHFMRRLSIQNSTHPFWQPAALVLCVLFIAGCSQPIQFKTENDSLQTPTIEHNSNTDSADNSRDENNEQTTDDSTTSDSPADSTESPNDESENNTPITIVPDKDESQPSEEQDSNKEPSEPETPEQSLPEETDNLSVSLAMADVSEDDGQLKITARLNQATDQPVLVHTTLGDIEITAGALEGKVIIDRTDSDVYLDKETVSAHITKITSNKNIDYSTEEVSATIFDTVDVTEASLSELIINAENATATVTAKLTNAGQTTVYLSTNLGEIVIAAGTQSGSQTFNVSTGSRFDAKKVYAELQAAQGGNFEQLELNPHQLRNPPYWGTAYIAANLITDADPTAFSGLVAAGQANRTMYDRRVNNWVNENAYLFNASFNDGLQMEIQVNPEFGSVANAQKVAEKYAYYVGKLPTTLRKDGYTMWIHGGEGSFGGGNNNFLIHDVRGEQAIADGTIEEVLMHEGSHTSIDTYHKNQAGWLDSQRLDVNFISNYAFDYPTREDLAESLVPYFAARIRPERVDEQLKQMIEQTIPHRLDYFDTIDWDWYPQL